MIWVMYKIQLSKKKPLLVLNPTYMDRCNERLDDFHVVIE